MMALCPMARRLRLLTHGLKTARRAPRASLYASNSAIKVQKTAPACLWGAVFYVWDNRYFTNTLVTVLP